MSGGGGVCEVLCACCVGMFVSSVVGLVKCVNSRDGMLWVEATCCMLVG